MTADHPTHRVNRLTSTFIHEIETASPDSPVTVDNLVPGSDTYADVLRQEVIKFDGLYARHDELFAADKLDHDAVYDLTNDMLKVSRGYRKPFNNAVLGIATLQLAAAGAVVVQHPELLKNTSDQETVPAVTDVIGTLAAQQMSLYEGRWWGSVNTLPTTRLGYPGHLVDTHLAFWRETLFTETFGPTLDQDLVKRVGLIWPRFSGKVLMYDGHSAAGRPERGPARQAMMDKIDTFEKTPAAKTEGYKMDGNVLPSIELVETVIKQATKDGYSVDRALQIAMTSSLGLGRLTERVSSRRGPWPGLSEVNIVDNGDGPKAVLSVAPYQLDPLLAATVPSYQEYEKRGGTCPARNLVSVKADTLVYQNIRAFRDGLTEAIGITPPFFRENQGGAYVDPAAMTVAFGAFALAQNSEKYA